MRKIVPLAAIGCVFVCGIGLIVAGTIVLGIGVYNYVGRLRSSEAAALAERMPAMPAPVEKHAETLEEARKNFKTVSVARNIIPRGDLLSKAPPDANIVTYTTSEGAFHAYLSKPRNDGTKRPAVIWAHDSFDGISNADWEQARAFHDAGFVLIIPSFRGENLNAGRFEMFFGEVDDLLAAVNYAASLPDVNPDRIYVAGYGAGGTLALLTATWGKTKVRAFFSICGLPDTEEYLQFTNGFGEGGVRPPFNLKLANEAHLRSALPFVYAINRPTFYFGVVADGVLRVQAEKMARIANQAVPFQTFIFARPSRNTVVGPVIKLICSKIDADSGENGSTIQFERDELTALFPKRNP